MLSSLFDFIFPPSEHALLVRNATRDELLNLLAPLRVGDAVALLPYRTPLVTALIHEAKFHNNIRAQTLLGTLLGAYLASLSRETLHIIPIPLARERLRERGHNQVVRIAEEAGKYIPLTIHHHLLEKVRNTPPQTSLGRSERIKNLDGVFRVEETTLPKETSLILLDDIVTTGTTLGEAARALTRAGFSHIDQLALAH